MGGTDIDDCIGFSVKSGRATMLGEGKNQDYKVTIDVSSERTKVDLVKNIAAIANSGGGRIIFGRDETRKPGVEKAVTLALDSARLCDFTERYIAPSKIELAHETIQLQNGKYIHVIEIAPAQYPIVMSRQGDWKGADSKKDRPLFLNGDIWIRHSSKTERVAYQDIRSWIEEAKQKEREALLEKITMLANLPEGATIEVVTSEGETIDSPSRLIRSACRRRDRDPNHLLSSDDLIWIYLQREYLKLDDAELGIIIASALRRSATLYWWLILADERSQIVVDELERALAASDRDKSDAARSVIELAAIYATTHDQFRIINALRESRYAHFRSAAEQWFDSAEMKQNIKDRVCRARIEGDRLIEIPTHELEVLGTQLAKELSTSSKPALSRKLADVNRVIWSKKSRFADFFE